jgi:prepilin-type N-terminal cleavage/methylation domain-containing protein
MQDSKTQKRTQGFSLLELMIVIAVAMVLAKMAVPRMMTTLNDISLRYVATDLSGLLQSARIQAVRQNAFYSMQPGTLASGTPIYYMSAPTALYALGDPFVPISTAITVHQGPGSGAPNETPFLASLKFVVDPAADAPSFSARGLPCIGANNACAQIPGQGFVIFVSRAVVMGNTPWAAVVVNPSGHIQVWTCDSTGNWVQRD